MSTDERTPSSSVNGNEPQMSGNGAARPALTGWVFGEGYVRSVIRWSILAAAVGGVVGWLVAAEIAFAMGMWAGAAVDITTFRQLAAGGMETLLKERSPSYTVVVLFVRLAAKGLLLAIAALLPWQAAFWGVFGGVLVVEFMLVAVAAVHSIGDAFQPRARTGGGMRS